jgi:hypothetical protein
MKEYYYLKGLRKTIIQFLDTLNDIQVARYDENGNFTQLYKVPVKFGVKRKIWYWLEERKNEQMHPMISVQMTGLEFDTNRLVNKQFKVTRTKDISGSGITERFPNPSPYNINFSVSIWALNMTDIDQIIEQILPFYNPYIFIKIKIPELDADLDLKVIFNSVSPDVSNDIPDDDYRNIVYNMEFTVHGYLFRPVADSSLIKRIITKFYADEDAWAYMGTESTYTSGASGHESESTYIKAVPPWYDNDGEILYKYYIFPNTNKT